ncbi:MAG: PLP-dependent aminotransferase family protein [Deltaproteobacteria bacterium]|nr:PLP-dependent aminotransferase family protein [Deltaproteobacteria bacterium]
MIDFGVGQPSPSLLPLSLLNEAAKEKLSRDDNSILAYGNEQGNGYLRKALAQFLSGHYQMRVDLDDLLITAGASQGLDLICTLFTKPGDTILVEEPSYFLALRIFADHGLNVVGLPMDEKGLIIEALEEKLSQHSPIFLYTVPAYHNPSSVTLAAVRRERLVQLSQKHHFIIVADEVYQLLAYGEAPPLPLAGHIETGSVLSLGSFSKIMAPGLRLGWIQAGRKILDRIIGCGLLDSGGGLNPFTSAVVCSAIEMGFQQKQLTTLQNVYRQRKIAFCNALREHLPVAVRFTEPDGGFFVWLRFPEEVDTKKMLAVTWKNYAGYLPGIKFSSCNDLKNYARLSFSYFDTPDLEEGAKRLSRAVKKYMKSH